MKDENERLKRRPVVVSRKRPDQIVGDFHDELVKILGGYRKVRESLGWDEYSKRLGMETRDTMADVLKECRKNGYVNPHVYNGKLYWDFVAYHPDDKRKTQNQCCLCEFDCSRKDWKGVLIKEPCWRQP
jgi:hypothetical protein